MDILYLVDRLENLIASSRRMPLVNQIIVKEGDILSIIDQMRTTIPDEIKQARRVIQDKERILAQAQAEASTLLTRAREETERAMNREGLLQMAEKRSEELVQYAEEQARVLIREAEEDAEQLKIESDAYVAETLHSLREHLLSIETEVGRSILSIERGLESLEAPSDEEGQGPINELAEEEFEDELPPDHQVPRRASLAADTMGGPAYQ